MAGAGGWDAIGSLKPTRTLLMRYVIPRVASRWLELGIELYQDADVPHLERIQRECPGNFTKACMQMLSHWRKAYVNATWNRLIKALQAPGLQLSAIALDIKRDLVKDLAEDDGSDTVTDDILSQKPEIWKLRVLVIPEVKAHWEYLAFSMDYEIAQVEAIKRDGRDMSERCTKLLQDWLETSHGGTPKTWEKLLEKIKDVDELNTAAERIKEKLIGDDASIASDKNPGKVLHQSSKDKNQLKLELLQSMSKARKDNCTLKVRYGKVLVCGASAAGKTNFLKLLIEEEKFEPSHISTELAKHQQVAILAMKAELSTYSGEKIMFKKMDIDREIDQLMKYLPKKYTTPSIQTPAEEEEERITESEIPQHTYTIAEDIMCTKLAATADAKQPVKIEKVWNILTFIDTGGQPQFISMLPAVNSFAMITFIVHKMTGGKASLTQKVVVTHGNEHGKNSFEQWTHEYTYNQLIKTLMSYAGSMLLPDKEFLNEIKESTVGKEQNIASISFIGTHSKNVSENDIKEIDDELIEIIKLSGAGNIRPKLNKNYRYLVPLDNEAQKEDFTKADTNNLKYTDPSEVCVYIHEWLKKQDTYSVPIQWLLLELEIRKVCIENDCSFMTLDEVMKLSRDKQLGEDDFIKNGLRFHHLFGVLLYYEIEGIPELIITDHQWLFKKLTKIVLCDDCYDTNEELDKCQKEGIFEEKLLDRLDISKDFENSGINIESINPNKYFLGLLQHLRIIASLNEDPTQYFMPSLLKSCDLTNIQGQIPGTRTFVIEANESIHSEPLLIRFVKSFDIVNSFPRGIFCFLVVQLIHCTNWEVVKPAHDNMLSFEDTEHYITLIDRVFFLEVHVRPFDIDYNPVNGDVFTSIKDVILTAFYEVGSRLDINIELECGFLCKNCNESHIALKKKNPKYYFCDDGKRTKLEKSHKIWFKNTCQDTLIISDHNPKGTVEERPTMKQLLGVMRIKSIGITVKWFELGLELFDDDNILQQIAADHCNDAYTCCLKMFQKWLEKIPDANWNRLVAALNEIGMEYAANVVNEQFISAHTKSVSSSNSTYVSSSSTNLWSLDGPSFDHDDIFVPSSIQNQRRP